MQRQNHWLHSLGAMTVIGVLATTAPSTAADDSEMDLKRQAEIARGTAGSPPIEERPGKVVKGSELDLARYPGMRADDDVKLLQDEVMGEEFAVNLTLARKWREVLGGSGPEWTGKVAPAITPGTVITPQNYTQFEGLDELLPPTVYARLEAGAWDPIKEIRVGETDPLFPTHEYIEATSRHDYERSGFGVENWKGGLPYPQPKNGDEVIVNYFYRYWPDDLEFDFKWHLVGDGDQLQRTIEGRMFAMRMNGRTLVEPKPVYGDAHADVLEKLGTVIKSPKDVRGVALSRTRYVDLGVNDSLQIYIPAMRRVRRLSGRDTQDPIVGTDATWDDYLMFYQQINEGNARVELIGQGEVLHPSAYTKPKPDGDAGDYLLNVQPFDMTDVTATFRKWQRRPVWIIDVISKDPSYIYTKRRLWVDREIPNVIYAETWDRKGNQWKTLQGGLIYNPTNGDSSNWDFANFADNINRHRTTWIFEWESLPGLTSDDFDTSLLTKQTN